MQNYPTKKNDDSLSHVHNPADEELHDRKKKWADEGCLPDDYFLYLKNLRSYLTSGKLTLSEIRKSRDILERKNISQDIKSDVLALLDLAVPCDVYASLMEDIRQFQSGGFLNEEQIETLRKMIVVQNQQENLTPHEFHSLLAMIGIDALKR